MWSILHIGT